ncbi:Hypothetical protein LBF_0590 [Leptospira biflexa serovar Patoc strain 'Patoc 1 (Ames)']|uniref:Cytochrome c-552/4 domain-containing protein n=1 Tax=Leptospira biflexa serovar Patoc (strain Patoc 1 / ATCC 23582 / Paris) TaxID=456481 RepID=B0SKJ1_LEPBP|nr:multiheme c-type cytochrome [Leptospira biflexa]ABZ93126.1 Hypothetical protein LBF_0590 [Leptospira biflexa serovar Patoc strain 'Patoc 1 (Ames)']ABZ96748.1 Hypothetical protein; putative signal peptide [Leptospira biflexa serovar Patoc strain 'Patoc 1 (Paris)']
MFRFKAFVFLLICNSFSCSESKILNPMSNGKFPLDISSNHWNSTKDCERCHKSISQSHQKSAHANAWKDPIFQIAFQKEPRQWCMNCHAPLHTFGPKFEFSKLIQSQPNKETWAEGVNCAVCHVRDNEIYGKHNRDDIKDHRVIRDEVFSNNSLCNNCHLFHFPQKHFPEVEYTNVIMQGTGSESDRLISKVTKTELCVNCHLKNNHKLNGTVFDLDWMDNWKVDVATTAKDKEHLVQLTLKFPKMGHKFPTGDLFRSLVFRIFDKNQNVISEYRFERKMRLVDLYEIRDTRLSPNSDTKFTKSFLVKEIPDQCELVYHLQLPIEHELIGHLSEFGLKRKIFRDNCFKKTNKM